MPLLRISPEKVIEIPCTLFSSSTVELHLENVSEHPFVAYKIKTTAPKSYLVRPSTGKYHNTLDLKPRRRGPSRWGPSQQPHRQQR